MNQKFYSFQHQIITITKTLCKKIVQVHFILFCNVELLIKDLFLILFNAYICKYFFELKFSNQLIWLKNILIIALFFLQVMLIVEVE